MDWIWWIVIGFLAVIGLHEILRKINEARRESIPCPPCFGMMPPNPQHQAEYDCVHCRCMVDCWYRSNAILEANNEDQRIPPPS